MESLVPGSKPIEIVSFYEEFAWYYPKCEPETKHWFLKNIQPDWTIFDVGANVGIYSVLFSRMTPAGRVIAFEPTVTIDMLRLNLEHNRCANVQVEAIALGAKTGVIEDNLFRIWGRDPERQIYPFSTLDDYVSSRGISRLDCIKIDVDSFDFEVLRGAQETLRTLKPIVVVELNHALEKRNQSNVEALEWLRTQGIEEVLSLDADNFVIWPGRSPGRTYPVKSVIRIAFADTKDMPPPFIEGVVEQLQNANIRAGVAHGAAQIVPLADGAGIEVVTDSIQWGFAFGVPLAIDTTHECDLQLSIDLEVLDGRLGVGCVDDENEYLGSERYIDPGPRRTLLMPLRNVSLIRQLMLRNAASDGVRSSVRLFGVGLGRKVGDDGKALSSRALANRVHRSMGASDIDVDFGVSGEADGVDVVDYSGLKDALGFPEAFIPPAGAAEGSMVNWKMERDDAPIFRYVYRNLRPRRHLEFGTWEGFGVVACAESCDAEIWTLNLPDGEKSSAGASLYCGYGDSGEFSTDSGDHIGHLYREAGYGARVHQILTDSTLWTPDMKPGFFDSVLIDGGHAFDVVTSDTDKAIPLVRPGGIIMWHDFCPDEDALRAHTAPRGVVLSIASNLARWRPAFSGLFWVRPSWVLVGVRR